MMFFFGLIMFLCLVPTTWIYFFQIYPAKWKEKKLVFGVKNRSEFQEGETAQQVEALVKKHNTQALGIAIVVTILSALFLLLKGVTVQTAIWTIFIMIALVALVVPYYFGNREMKALKRSLGIKSEAGVTYTDLSNASAVHASLYSRFWWISRSFPLATTGSSAFSCSPAWQQCSSQLPFWFVFWQLSWTE